MKKITFLFCLYAALAQAQNIRPRLDESMSMGRAVKSAEFRLSCAGEITGPGTDLKWRPLLINKCQSFEPKIPDQEKIEELKRQKTRMKFAATNQNKEAGENGTATVKPVMGVNFLGNTNNGHSPMDNSIAISDGGWIISVANTTIEYDDVTGYNSYFNDIASFFNDPGITNVCDPVVIYDRLADRFIFFAQECAGNASNSYLLICFSKTNNPNDGWWKYKLTGNPLNNNTWFDYPKLAISNNELYISGNLFTNNPNATFNQAILYQIEKANGYNGGNINWQYWKNISGSPFTLLPVSDGQGQSYGPGCLLVATSPGGGNQIKVYDLTNDMSASNEQLNYYTASTTSYSPSGDAGQAGTNCLLDNGDCRALSGFYLNGKIHFVFHSDVGSGWNGINYNRLNVTNLQNLSTTFGSVGTADYSYPSVVSYATTQYDDMVMIGFGRSSKTIFPEIRVVNCDGAYNWSQSVLVKASSDYVSFSSTTLERWGDYTGTARRHNSAVPSVWVNGMYGTPSNEWNTWIAEIHDNEVGLKELARPEGNMKLYPNPVAETFVVEFNLDQNTELHIEVTDQAGKTVRQLYHGKASAGLNNFSFNKAQLSPGMYQLNIKNTTGIIRHEKIVVAD